MNRSEVQEFKLFRVCLVLTFSAPLVFLFLEHCFVPADNRWWMYGIIIASVAYSSLLFRFSNRKNFRFGVLLFIGLHLVLDSIAVCVHSPQYLAVAFLLTYTFIGIFNIILLDWPIVGVTDGIIFLAVIVFVLVPATGLSDSLKTYGYEGPFALTAILVYFALLLIVGTSVAEIKRRTESQLRELNRTLNQRVKEKVGEFKRADRAARQSQEQLVRILRNIPVGVIIMDQNLNVIYSNDSGIKQGEMPARDSHGLPLEQLKEYFMREKEALISGQTENMLGQRLEYTAPEGCKKTIRYSWVCVKVPDENEDMIRLVLITEDITREEDIREKLIQTNHLTGMGKMAAGLVHEVNNPLAGILLNLELLELGLVTPQKQEQVFDALKTGVRRVDQIVKSFLSFSRQDQPQKIKTDIHAVLKDMLALAVNFKQFHRVNIKTEYGQDIPEVWADRYRLEQVFVNLLNNACDAMARKGGELVITTARQGSFVLITFRDDGIGIKKEDLPNIFSPFFSTKERAYSTGLGLSTSYGIVQEHGGTIEVESREGVGTAFTIRLPIEAEAEKNEV